MLSVIPCEIAVRIFPEVTWLASISEGFRRIGYHLYHYGIGLGVAIIAPCLVWENIMYLREKRRREKAEALAAAVNAELHREREAAEAAKAQLQHEVTTLKEQVAQLSAAAVDAELHREREAAEAAKAQLQHEVTTLKEQVAQLSRELEQLKASNDESG